MSNPNYIEPPTEEVTLVTEYPDEEVEVEVIVEQPPQQPQQYQASPAQPQPQ